MSFVINKNIVRFQVPMKILDFMNRFKRENLIKKMG